jgi:hypothetical protein
VKTKREIDNAVKKMQGVIKGVLYHSVKTVDEKKRHRESYRQASRWKFIVFLQERQSSWN